jgi:rhodanese-related sulfurtransferase
MDTTRFRRLVATAGVLLAAVACAGDGKGEPFTLLSMDQVEKLVGKPDVVLVDANPQDVYRKNHLPGARWWRSAPLAQLLPAQKNVQVVFYCASPG